MSPKWDITDTLPVLPTYIDRTTKGNSSVSLGTIGNCRVAGSFHWAPVTSWATTAISANLQTNRFCGRAPASVYLIWVRSSPEVVQSLASRGHETGLLGHDLLPCGT